VVVVTSDHGESIGEHGKIGHNGWYNEQLKVPLIIYDPASPSFVSDAPAQSIDILPTVLGILGVDTPASLSGVDLTATLRDGADPDSRTRLAQAGRHGRFGLPPPPSATSRWSTWVVGVDS
jgi:arylsulfatase A-like enzyme